METLNGKIDMNAVPNPFNENANDIAYLRTAKYVGPTNELEERI